MAHNESLRLAALDHSKYLYEYGQRITNDNLSTHEQFLKYPNGFTGTTVFDRVKFRGYTGVHVSEGLTGNLRSASSVRGLMSAPYHAETMFTGFTEIGISAGKTVVADYGAQTKLQRKDSSLMTYPCQGVTGTEVKLDGENPSPYSPRNLGTSPYSKSGVFLI